jgi:3',5'-cyclic AMP phosphodiesterase CpdA
MPSATFAVISDLHCRLKDSADDSFLTVGAPRVPSNRHPVESLLELIDAEKPMVDALLIPGDLTNRANREGLNHAWEIALEIGRHLRVPVVPVIGKR